jgi:hypothetical protein
MQICKNAASLLAPARKYRIVSPPKLIKSLLLFEWISGIRVALFESLSNHKHRKARRANCMRPRQKIFGLILAMWLSMIPPYVVFSAQRTSRSSPRFRNPQTTRPQRPPPQRFHPFGLWGAGGVGDEQTIIVQQVQPLQTESSQSREPATNRVYVQPRWVDGGNGVQVSVPGYWTDEKQTQQR